MTEPESFNRPGSAAAARYFTSSPRPSVASRTSRSSLRREHDPQADQLQPQSRRLSSAQSHTPSPQPPPSVEEHALSEIDQQQQQQQQTHQEGEEGGAQDDGAQPSFSPFFTLLSSSTHSSQRLTIHHPTVHFVFADDDPDILTAALAYHHRGGSEQDATSSPDSNEKLYNKEPRDRAVILDMVPSSSGNGLQVAWASSLSPDWAVVAAQVMPMEDQANSGGANTAAGGVFAASSPSLHTGPLMLKIEGVAIEPSATSSSSLSSSRLASGGRLSFTPEGDLQSSMTGKGKQAATATPSPEEYPTLLQDFERRIGVLKRIAEASSVRQRRISSMDHQSLDHDHGDGGGSGKGHDMGAQD